VVTGKVDEFTAVQADQLRKDYADTPYAELASLAQAKNEYDNGNDEQALSHLDWVIKNAAAPELEHTARLRMARILLAQKKYDEAGAILEKNYPAAYTAAYEELRGDLYIARGDADQARAAYDKAISASASGGNRWLQLKRQDLGESEMGSTEQNDAAAVEPPA
jgi:predicted negative regulator of RcsB-dependent stress response